MAPLDLTVSDLIARLQKMNEEIRCDGTQTAAHTYPSSVDFRIINRNVEYDEIELVEIEANQNGGCGCWTGVTFCLRIKGLAILETKEI